MEKTESMKTIAIIVAGGSGTRFGAEMPKQFLDLCGEPILMRTIRAFDDALSRTDHDIIVTLPAQQMELWRELCDKHGFALQHRVVAGGETRWHSVKNALDSIDGVEHVDVIAVHDGVRPMASQRLITSAFATARKKGSAIPVVSLNDSVRQIDGNNGVSRALDRSMLRAVQTPQVFNARLLVKAYQRPYEPVFTDDASVMERDGNIVTLIVGDPNNLKITRPVDLAVAEYLLNNNA